jgi:hypothetical protein
MATEPSSHSADEQPSKAETARALENVRAIVEQHLGPYMKQQTEGFSRVTNLLAVAREAEQSDALVRLTEHCKLNATQDILRAAVVLIHAQLEEFLRTMARTLLPEGDEGCLNEIPLAGLGGRKDRFLLGKLAQHRGKMVDEVLRASVSEYLERSNYNSTTEIANLLRTLGFDVPEHDNQFAEIEQMIERRHKIVHRADRFEDANSALALQPIAINDVADWLRATQEFLNSLRIPLFAKLIGAKPTRSSTQPGP